MINLSAHLDKLRRAGCSQHALDRELVETLRQSGRRGVDAATASNAADWIAAADKREAWLRSALIEAADCIVRQASEIERLKKLIASGLAKVEADETLFVWAVEARAALEVKP